MSHSDGYTFEKNPTADGIWLEVDNVHFDPDGHVEGYDVYLCCFASDKPRAAVLKHKSDRELTEAQIEELEIHEREQDQESRYALRED